jgi:phage/plasmid-associated DNA primase
MSLPWVAPSQPLAPPLTDEDMRAALAGLEPGWYTARALYPRYQAWAEQNGRPLTKRNGFGMALRRVARSTSVDRGHVRTYELGPELVNP